MKICENCKSEHNGSYGSGRFCSKKCARGFSTKGKRSLINEKISKTLTKEPYKKICSECKKEFETKRKRQLFCSRSCNILDKNKKLTHSKQTRNKISNSLLQQYKEGKLVYGGTTKWYDYKDIKVQGTYELRTCKILDTWKEKRKIKDWEYTNNRIEYVGTDKEKHNYLLDFKVFENSGSFYYIETKGYEKPNDKLKWKAVRDKGYKLEIWFEKDIINMGRLV